MRISDWSSDVCSSDLAGDGARAATAYVTLEPCAHRSPRGPACADTLATSGLARVVIGQHDPDPRTSGDGIKRLAAAGIETVLTGDPASRASLAGDRKSTRLNSSH